MSSQLQRDVASLRAELRTLAEQLAALTERVTQLAAQTQPKPRGRPPKGKQ